MLLKDSPDWSVPVRKLQTIYPGGFRTRYESSSGDRWYLIRDPSGALFVRHEANVASGGQVEHEEIAAFLGRGAGPEQQELLRLIGTLVEEHPANG